MFDAIYWLRLVMVGFLHSLSTPSAANHGTVPGCEEQPASGFGSMAAIQLQGSRSCAQESAQAICVRTLLQGLTSFTNFAGHSLMTFGRTS